MYRKFLYFLILILMLGACKETSVSIIKHNAEPKSEDVKQSHRGAKKKFRIPLATKIVKPVVKPRQRGKKETLVSKHKKGGKTYTQTKQKRYIYVEGRKVRSGQRPNDSFTESKSKNKWRFRIIIFGNKVGR